MIIIFHRMAAHALLNFRKICTTYRPVLDPSTQYKVSLRQSGTGPHGIAAHDLQTRRQSTLAIDNLKSIAIRS